LLFPAEKSFFSRPPLGSHARDYPLKWVFLRHQQRSTPSFLNTSAKECPESR
jgi:hypothetical protein